MKVKDYLKKVETANEVLKLSNKNKYYNEEYTFYMDYDNFKYYKAKTYKEFKNLINKVFVPDFAKELLGSDVELNKKFYINGSSIEYSIE